MPYDYILYETYNGVAKITFNRPQALNALNPEMLKEAKTAVDEAGRDDEVGVVLLTGAGRAFSAGVDLISLADRKGEDAGQMADVGDILNKPAQALIEAIEILPKVVIGMINGFCMTGALELALACDLLIASDAAKFADTHTKWGLRCIWGMSARLPRRVGWLKAREMTYSARMVPADEAERIGLINRVVPADQLDAEVMELAALILSNSRDAVAAHKYLYNEGIKGTLEQALAREAATPIRIGDTAERVARFMKKD